MNETLVSNNPYVGPRSIKTGEAFWGRDREIRSLSALLLAERIVLLHSPSGAGKSSLIEAGLRPRMEERFRVSPLVRVNLEVPDELRSVAGLNRYLISTLLSLEEALPIEQHLSLTELATISLDAYLEKRALPDDAFENSLLLFDQFEEVLTVSPTDTPAKQRFFEQLGEALQNRRRWALFAIREDYMGGLAPYVRAIPNRLNVPFRLGLLGTQAAKLAVQQPAKDQGVDFTEAAAQKLVDDLSRIHLQQPDGSFISQTGPDVEPVQLQVVCYNLWQSPRADEKSISENDVQRVGSVDQALASFYAERLKDISQKSQVDERIVRQWFNERLITTEGIRSQVLKGAQSSAELPNSILSQLEGAYLIRGETRAGKTWYELSHDRLVQPIRLDNTAWFEQNLSVFQRRAVLWNQQGRSEGLLLRGKEFVEAKKKIVSLRLTADESVFLDACNKLGEREQRDRQQRRLIITGLVVTLVLLVLAVFFGFQANVATQDAKNQAASALTAQGEAALSAKNAATSQAKAEVAQLTAVANEHEAKKQAQIVFTRQLASQAQSRLSIGSSNQMLSDLISIQSLKVIPNADSTSFLINNNLAARPISRMTHDGRVSSVAFSPDGKYIVSGSVDKTVRVWEAATGKQVARMTHDDAVYAVAFSPDGKYVVSSSDDKTARVWEAASGKEVARMTHDNGVCAVAFSPDSKYVVSGSRDNTARVWEAASGKEVARMTHDNGVCAVAFSPGGKYIVSGGEDNARVWEAASGKEVVARMTQDDGVSSVIFSPDGKYVVSSGMAGFIAFDKTARVWEVATGKEVARMTHDGLVRSVAFSSDSKYVVSGSDDNTARVWEAASGKEVARMTHDGGVSSVAFSRDGRYVVSGSDDNTARVWEVSTGKEVARMTHDDHVVSVAFSPDGKYVVSGSGDNTVRVWEVATRDVPHNDSEWSVFFGLNGQYFGSVDSVAFSPDGKYVVSGSGDNTVRVWEVASGKEVARMTHDSWLLSVAFSPDGKYVVSGSYDKTARVWEAASGKEVARVTHDRDASAVAFSSDGKYVVSGSYDKTARVWEAASGKEVARMTHDREVSSVVFSPDGKYVVSGSWDNTARIWEAASGKEVARITHDREVSSVAFSPDGKYVVSGSYDNTARVWEAASGNEVARMTHDGKVSSVAFSPDGKYVVSSGCDKIDSNYICTQGSVRVWEAASGKEVARRMTHDRRAGAVAFSPDGKYIVSGGDDETVRVWAWRSEDVIANACAVMPRNLTRAEWQLYIGDALPYQKVCDNLPLEP